MSSSTTPKRSQRPAPRLGARSAADQSDFAIRGTAQLSKPRRVTSTASRVTEYDAALTREVLNLKTRIRALNAANLNLRRRVRELEAKQVPFPPPVKL